MSYSSMFYPMRRKRRPTNSDKPIRTKLGKLPKFAYLAAYTSNQVPKELTRGNHNLYRGYSGIRTSRGFCKSYNKPRPTIKRINQTRWHMPGYTGHLQSEKFRFGKSYSQTSWDVMTDIQTGDLGAPFVRVGKHSTMHGLNQTNTSEGDRNKQKRFCSSNNIRTEASSYYNNVCFAPYYRQRMYDEQRG